MYYVYSAGPQVLETAEDSLGSAMGAEAIEKVPGQKSCTYCVCIYVYVYIYIYIYIHECMCVCIYIYIYIRKAACGAEFFGIFYVEQMCFA